MNELTFFSLAPNDNPGVSLGIRSAEIPLGPGSPVLTIARYKSDTAPPLIKACVQKVGFSKELNKMLERK